MDADAVSNITSSPSSSSAADELRNKLARQTNDASGTSSGSAAAKAVPSAEDKERVDGGSGISAPPGSAEAVLAELQGLRKRYDAVVEYTVHLTAERDAIIARLEATQKDLIKEKSKKKGSDTSVQAKDTKVQKDKVHTHTPLPVFSVLFSVFFTPFKKIFLRLYYIISRTLKMILMLCYTVTITGWVRTH